jgi:hypothetical protein
VPKLPVVAEMDERCPLGLKILPQSICPLAAQSLRALRNNPGQAEKLELPCQWYINDRDSNYCFFKYIHDNVGKDHNTIDIASLLLTTQASVYSAQSRALQKAEDIGLAEMILSEQEEDDDVRED